MSVFHTQPQSRPTRYEKVPLLLRPAGCKQLLPHACLIPGTAEHSRIYPRVDSSTTGLLLLAETVGSTARTSKYMPTFCMGVLGLRTYGSTAVHEVYEVSYARITALVCTYIGSTWCDTR